MKLRKLATRAVRNWPPLWLGMEREREILHGEVGVLADAYSKNESETAIFLVIRVGAQKFLGALLFHDCACYKRILALLQANIGRPIREIAELDICARSVRE